MQSLKTVKYAKNFVLFFFRYAFVKGGINLAQVCFLLNILKLVNVQGNTVSI